MRKEVLAEGVELYLGDCREIFLGKVCGVVTDPPYGMDWNTDHTRFSGGDGGQKRRSWDAVANDKERFDPAPWLAFKEVVLWGCNHFGQSLPIGTTLVWLKRSDAGFGTF